MANGLRKLIRKARRFSNPSLTNGRLRKFGQRLRVEELEERIAPASLTPGDFTSWDIGADNGTFEATDGAIGISDGGVVSNITNAVVTVVDDTAPVVTVDGADWGANATTTIGISSSQDIGAINLTNIPVGITRLELVILSGADDTAGAGTLQFTDEAGTNLTYGGAYVADAGGDPSGATDAAGDATDGIGTITISTVAGHPGLDVQIQVETGVTAGNGTGTAGQDGLFAGIAAPTSATLVGNSSMLVDGITSLSWLGTVDPGANNIAITSNASIGSWTSGLVTTTGAGDLAVTADGIGTTSIQGVTVNDGGGTGDIAFNAGATGWGGAGVTLNGVTTVDGTTGLIQFTTAGAGGFLTVNTGAIASNGTGAITLAQAGTGSMGVVTGTTIAADANGGAVIIGSGTGALGGVSLSTTTINWGSATDLSILGTTMGPLTLGSVNVTSTGNVLVTATTSIGVTNITDITLNNAGNFTMNSGTTGFTGTVDINDIDVSGGGSVLITTTDSGAGTDIFANTLTVGEIDVAGGSTVTIQPDPAGTGTMADVTLGLVEVAISATAGGAVQVGNLGGAMGALSLAGITNSSQNTAGVTISGDTIASVASSASIETADADATDGTILIEANNGIAGGVTVSGVNGHVSGGGSGAATVTIEADQDDDGTGAFGAIRVEGNVGNDAGGNGSLVLFHGATFSTIDSPNIGLGGPATFTTGASTNVNGIIGAIGGSIQLASLGGAGAVLFQAHDGISAGQDIMVSGSIANGGNVTFNANADGADDNPNASGLAVPNFQSGTTIGTGGTQLIINTNGTATDNANARSMGTVTALDGYANLNLTVDGDVGLLTVSGDNSGAGNDLALTINTRAADGNANNIPATPGDLAGINVVDTANPDSVTIAAASWISGIIGDTETTTQGMIIAGGGEATDLFTLTGNLVIFNGDDTEDGATDTVDADYAAATPFFVDIVSGATAGGGQLIAAVRTSSPFFRAVLNSETFLADVDTPTGVTATVTYQLVTDQIEDDDDIGADLSHQETNPRITLDDINGLTAASELTISTSGPSEFDSGGITRSGALGAVNPDAKLISVEGDLYGDIGEPTRSFGDLEIIIIAGDASAANANGGANHTFHGTGLQGLGVGLDNDFIDGDNDDLPDTPLGFSSLLLGPNVIITTLDRDTSEPLTLPGTLNFQFADANAGGSFNRHIIVVGVGSQAIVYGIDGSGDSATALDAEYAFEGVGVSTAQPGATNDIDPNGIIDGYAMFARVNISGVDGISTDVSVREVDGTTTGSWFEFNTDLGLFNVTTSVSSISVGVDDGSDVLDNAVVTGNNTNNNNGTDFDRLGGGEAGGLKQGLQPATFISDLAAGLGNFVAQSMTDPGAANINVVVTGDLGSFTLTGDVLLQNPDHGNLDVNANAGSAAIAVGDDLEGDLVIPGLVDGDILIGIGLDLNGDNDVVDSGLTEITNDPVLGLASVGHDLDGDGLVDDANLPPSGWSELPGGNANGSMTIGSMSAFDILVYDNINNDIVITGADQDPEAAGMELRGDVVVIKAGGILGDLGEDVVVIERGIDPGQNGAIDDLFVIADGALNSGIFIGADQDDNTNQEQVTIEGTGINGPAVIGGSGGVDVLTIIDHEGFAPTDPGDVDVITAANEMVLQWSAGGIGDGTDTLGDVYEHRAGGADLTVTNPSGDAIDIGDVFLLDDGSVNVTSPGNIGVVVAADDATVPTSESLQDLITTSYDVVNSPTALDTASGDQADDLDYAGDIVAENAGGVIAEGDAGDANSDIDVDDTVGSLVSLNGSVHFHVHAGVSIGHIVASENIDGIYVSEGTLAIGDATVLNADLTSFGLSGVPSWFAGGILSEAGDIGSIFDENGDLETGTFWGWADGNGNDQVDPGEGGNEAIFTAVGTPTIVQNIPWFVNEAMGTIYVPTGSMSADISVGGDFGGIVVPTGDVYVQLNVALNGMISRVVAPSFTDDGGNASSNWDRAGAYGGIRVISGELVAVVGADIDTDGLDVSVTGATTLAILDGTDILLVDGLATGSSLDVEGDVATLTIDGNWDGTVAIDPNVDDDSNGEVATIIVTGAVSGSGDLEAYNFGELLVQGANAAESTGSLAGRDSVTFTNLANETQTVFLDGSNKVSATYTTVFGKMTELQITGNGKAGIVSVNGAFDAVTDLRELRQIGKAARTGKANANLDLEGSAHLGNLEIALGSRINVKDAVVNGDLDAFGGVSPKQNVKSLWVSEDAGTVDIGNKINRAFIGGDVDEFSARVANKVLIGGDATNVNAFKMTRSEVRGTTQNLTIDGSLIYSMFSDVINANVNRSYRSVIG